MKFVPDEQAAERTREWLTFLREMLAKDEPATLNLLSHTAVGTAMSEVPGIATVLRVTHEGGMYGVVSVLGLVNALLARTKSHLIGVDLDSKTGALHGLGALSHESLRPVQEPDQSTH
jgi:hypothetical protein